MSKKLVQLSYLNKEGLIRYRIWKKSVAGVWRSRFSGINTILGVKKKRRALPM